MKKNLLLLIVVILSVALWLHAGGSYGSIGIGPIAPNVAMCPKPTVGQMKLCPVGANGSYETYVSYSGGAYTATGW
jgi:hypothetical protein